MNKFEKIAVQCTKDDLKKPWYAAMGLKFRMMKNTNLQEFKNKEYNYQKALDFKNWNKINIF